MNRGAVAFLSGAIFSGGLCLSGMTRPSKVLAFLDVAGAWDPSLAFVMVGAIAVAAIGFRVDARRARTEPARESPTPPPPGAIDSKLLAGAAIFGVGWGLSGLCPGPAIVSLASGQTGALVFVASMLLGTGLSRAVLAPPDRGTYLRAP